MALSQLLEFQDYGGLVYPNNYEIGFIDSSTNTNPVNFSVTDVTLGDLVNMKVDATPAGYSTLTSVNLGSEALFSFYERDNFSTLTYFLGWFNSFQQYFQNRNSKQYKTYNFRGFQLGNVPLKLSMHR